MTTYTVKSNLNHDGKEYRAGDTVELDEEVGKHLVATGTVVEPQNFHEPEAAPENRERVQSAEDKAARKTKPPANLPVAPEEPKGGTKKGK